MIEFVLDLTSTAVAGISIFGFVRAFAAVRDPPPFFWTIAPMGSSCLSSAALFDGLLAGFEHRN
jgi:hypothetical protein